MHIDDIAAQVVKMADGDPLTLPDEAAQEVFRSIGVELMFDEIKASLHDFGVDFDVFFHENDVHTSGAVDRAIDRLRELLAERPERARGYDGETLLMYLPPDDEDKALEAATALLEHGADPAIKDPQGLTAADRAEKNAMYRVAALLRGAERRRAT